MHGALRRGARTSQARGFASKFYDILSQESSDIITWTESGQAFQVLDYTRFSEEILLKYFRHNKFSSFRRQLNLYGYRKVIKGPDAGAYMHPSFQRDRPDLLGDVKKGKVPHYDMHGVNEIHGQHFRHHPPGAMKDPSSRDTMQSAPVTPELHGEGLGMQPVAGHGAMPVAHNTPGTEAAVALSNMSLEGMPPSTGWAQQHTQSMDALTLTPAWGGPHDSIAETGPPRSISESAGVGGRVSVSGGTRGSMSTGAPVAYWHKPRKSRTMSSQLVFSTQPAKDTLEILQPDPNLCDVMDVICQCMEVRSSTEGSEESNLSQLSACSFKKDSHLGTGSFKKDSHLGTGSFKRDSSRRSSISDLLNSISWESAMRGSLLARNSLAGAAEAAISEAEQETHSRSGHTNRTNSSNSSSTHSNRSITVNTTRPGMKQWPSFDPARELGGGNSATVTSMAQPAVVSLSPLGQQPLQQQLEQGQKQPQRGRPSFDPNSESAMAASLRAPGNARRQAAERAAKAAAVEPTHEVAIGGGNMPHGTPNTMARETSRESTTARIFNAAAARPAAATAGTTAASAAAGVGGIGGSGGVGSGGGGVGVGAGVGGVGDGVSGVGGGVWEMSGGGVQTSQSWGSRKDSAETCSVTSARTSTTSVTTSTTSTAVHWDASLQAHPVQLTAAAASAGPSAVTTASTWGLETELLQVGEGLSPQVSMSPPTSSVTSSPTSPADTEAFTRPALGRMSSLMWLTEPTPSRRPTIHESNEVDRLLANTEKFAAWTRVTDDPDSMLVAKSISDYLG